MPQYTSSATNRGVVVNTVLDTTSNVQTITVTLPSGQTATTTVPGNTEGVPASASKDIQAQFAAQGVTVYDGPAVNRGVSSTTTEVVNQNAVASRTAVATGNPPPAESAAIPVAAANNPNTTPVPSEPPVENATVPTTGQTAADAAFQEANASEQQVIDPNSDPNTNIGTQEQNQDTEIPIDKPNIDPNTDPNTNIGTEGQTVTSPSSITENVFDPRQEVTESVFDPRQEVTESVFDPSAGGNGQGISTALNNTRSTATKDDSANFQQKPDWRARLSLAPNANYLYKVPSGQAGILAPLQSTDGVIFPYTPAISVTYSAGYDASDLIHSNYKVYQYKGSSVDTVSITADFTAQDTTEANYLLAVIHFFRSVTKMFYGQDKNPNNGVPPPLCYLSGFGAYTFDAHPLVVTNFTYTTPTDVDYIRAGSQTNQPGVNISQQKPVLNSFVPRDMRISMSGLAPTVPNFTTQNTMINSEATYVPTKIQLQVTCIPIVTRNDISNKFSLKEYATGALLRGSKRSGGGIW